MRQKSGRRGRRVGGFHHDSIASYAFRGLPAIKSVVGRRGRKKKKDSETRDKVEGGDGREKTNTFGQTPKGNSRSVHQARMRSRVKV